MNTILLTGYGKKCVLAQDGFQFLGQDNILIGFVGEEQLITGNFSIAFQRPEYRDKRCYTCTPRYKVTRAFILNRSPGFTQY